MICARFLSFCRAIVAGLLMLSAVAPSTVAAQAYPTKPIHMVIPYPAGGSIDVSGRRLADELAIELGQPIVVENRSGANGIIGTEMVARAAPDGYTVLFTTIAAHAGNPWTYKKLPYDSINDFAPITVINSIPLLLVAHPSFPAHSIQDLVKLAKEKPGTINYASFGTGGMAHLAGVELELMGGIQMNHVPYKGGAPALADVLGGHVELFFSGINSALPHIQSGRLRALAVSGTTRAKVLPDVPAVNETPGFSEYEASVAPALWAPAKTPPEIINRLRAAVVKVVQNPKYREKLERDGEGDPIANTPDQMSAMVKNEMSRFGKLIKAAGITPE